MLWLNNMPRRCRRQLIARTDRFWPNSSQVRSNVVTAPLAHITLAAVERVRQRRPPVQVSRYFSDISAFNISSVRRRHPRLTAAPT